MRCCSANRGGMVKRIKQHSSSAHITRRISVERVQKNSIGYRPAHIQRFGFGYHKPTTQISLTVLADNQTDQKSRWKNWWDAVSVHNKELINDPTVEVNGFNLPSRTWLRLNRIRTGQGCCAFLLHRWNIVQSPLCQCGEVQTMKHLVEECPIHSFHESLEEIHSITATALDQLNNLTVEI